MGPLFALPAIWLTSVFSRHDIDTYPRVLSPLLVLLGLRGLTLGSWLMAAPLCMVAPRVGVQLAPQVLGILRGLFTA